MSALYAAALILHPGCRTRYIEVNWPKKWVKSTLEKVRKLWEDYRETTLLSTSSISISYDKRLHKPRELNTFDQIAQSLKQVSRLASQDEYEDYNSGELVELSTEASALV
jgi:hypothetical protein